jgi:hypothetical protein
VSTTSIARPVDGPGSPLDDPRTTPEAGLDLKWIPNADTALDFTVNPDFSQVEADTAQITAPENGFVPQGGFREVFGRAGWNIRPNGFVRRIRMYANTSRQIDRSGALVNQLVAPTLAMDVRWNGFVQLRLNEQRIRNQQQLFDRRQFSLLTRFYPSQAVQEVIFELTAGKDADSRTCDRRAA